MKALLINIILLLAILAGCQFVPACTTATPDALTVADRADQLIEDARYQLEVVADYVDSGRQIAESADAVGSALTEFDAALEAGDYPSALKAIESGLTELERAGVRPPPSVRVRLVQARTLLEQARLLLGVTS